jgi:hypothetical protein
LAGEKRFFLCTYTVQRKGVIQRLKKGVQAAASDGGGIGGSNQSFLIVITLMGSKAVIKGVQRQDK